MTKYLKFCLVLLVLLIVSNPAFGFEPVSFSLKRGVPEVEVMINDSVKALFIIDTGADHVYIDNSFAEKHGLLSGSKMPMRPTTGVNNKVEAYQIFLRSLQIGELKQNVVNAVTIDLHAIIKDTSRGLPDGILGYSFLKSQKTLLNYGDSTLQFLEPNFRSMDWKEAVIPIVVDKHLVIINTTVNDSVETRMILDTGASSTVFSPGLAKILNLSDTMSVAKVRLDKKFTIPKVGFIVRDISPITKLLPNSKIHGLIGTTFLGSLKFVIDYDKSQLILIAN